MAMTPGDFPESLTDRDIELLRSGAQQLRHHVDDRWVEISERVLVQALNATRRSRLIKAASAAGVVQISEQVLIAYLRDRIDGQVPGSALSGVDTQVGDDGTLQGLTIELIAQYGVPLIPIADQVREQARQVIAEILGLLAPPIIVSATHVHFGDVSVGDPHIQDPAEE